MARVTLRDVADQAEVSVRTVSNVVNEFPHVASVTRNKVQAAIAELGYRPNVAARQLRQGQGILVSLVLPEIDSPYFSELAARLVRAAENRGWTVHIEQTDGKLERERSMLQGGYGLGADAVVFSPWTMAASELSRGPSAPPVVMLGERSGVGLVDHVAVDNVAAANEATTYLIHSGRRRVAAIGLQPHLSNETAGLRLRGYRQAIARAGFDLDERLEVEVDRLHRADGATAMRRLLKVNSDIDGVFCFSDQLALGAMHALAGAGRRVPHDVSVVGFDNIEDGRYSVPMLSTIAPDKEQLIELTLQCLSDRLVDHTQPARELVVEHRLEIRGSS